MRQTITIKGGAAGAGTSSQNNERVTITVLLMRNLPSAPQTSRWARLTVQLAGLTVAALGIPLLIDQARYGRIIFESDIYRNTLLANLLAAWAALIFFRRVTAYPGTRGFSYIIPAFAGTFGVAALVLFALRLPYSSTVLTEGFVASLLYGFVLTYFITNRARPAFHLVPAGKYQPLLETREVNWLLMETPHVPDPAVGPIVADLRFDHEPAWERMLADAALMGHPVYHTKQLRESLTGKVDIEHLSENSLGSLVPNLAYNRFKRAVDFLAVLILLPFVLLLMLATALAIRLDLPGPVFFNQDRMGYRGRPFRMIKFRTMTPRAQPIDADEARQDAMTQDSDLRVTRVGQFLRRMRIDELPQLLNVLRGEMSLIGPRPEALPLSAWYESELPFYSYRHIVRPGLTGWAQVNQGHVADLASVNTKLNYDFYYIKYFSAWLDALIALRTVGIVLTGFGSK